MNEHVFLYVYVFLVIFLWFFSMFVCFYFLLFLFHLIYVLNSCLLSNEREKSCGLGREGRI